MKYLIDTQILIWFNLDNERLKSYVIKILENPLNQIYVSQISLMEIAVKQSIGKLPQLLWDTQTIIQQLQKDGITLINISEKHISTYKRIPFHAEHRDPFDRFLLATALSEHITLISADEAFDLYSDIVSLMKA